HVTTRVDSKALAWISRRLLASRQVLSYPVEARFNLLEIKVDCLLSLQASYAKRKRVFWTVIRHRESPQCEGPGDLKPIGGHPVHFDVRLNGHAASTTSFR